jgi:carboxyl-terminal processing protease
VSTIFGLLLFDDTLTTVQTNLTRNTIQSYIKDQYIGDAPDEQMKAEGELRGLVGSLNDPYSQYLSAEETTQFRNSINEEYEGIGVRFVEQDGVFVITQVMVGGPAEVAGVQKNDILLSVDSETVAGTSLDEVVTKIKGPQGTSVELTFARGEDKEEVGFRINRAAIKTELVELSFEDDIAIMRVTSFGDDMYSRMRAAAQQIEDRGDVKGIVLDLRSNTGGILNAGIVASSFFVDEGDVITYEIGNDFRRTDKAVSTSPNLKKYPLAIVVDQYTASAAEIMAAGIRDNRLTGNEANAETDSQPVIIGQTTFGKGVVQQLFPLPNGGTLKLTVAEWLTPQEQMINKIGIKPDIEIDPAEGIIRAKEELAR